MPEISSNLLQVPASKRQSWDLNTKCETTMPHFFSLLHWTGSFLCSFHRFFYMCPISNFCLLCGTFLASERNFGFLVLWVHHHVTDSLKGNHSRVLFCKRLWEGGYEIIGIEAHISPPSIRNVSTLSRDDSETIDNVEPSFSWNSQILLGPRI